VSITSQTYKKNQDKFICSKDMIESANEMTPQEKIIQERVTQARKFLTSNGFNQSIRDLWSEIKEDSKYDLL